MFLHYIQPDDEVFTLGLSTFPLMTTALTHLDHEIWVLHGVNQMVQLDDSFLSPRYMYLSTVGQGLELEFKE